MVGFETVATMEIGRLIVIGFFCLLMAGIMAVTIIASVMFAADGKWGKREPDRHISTYTLSFGIVLISVGVGMLVSAYAIPNLSAWGLAGILMLSSGIGLIIAHSVASSIENR